MEFDNLYDEYQMKKMRKMKKTKGGVLGIPNMGIMNRLRGPNYIPPLVVDPNNEDIDHRLFQQMVQNHPANRREEEPFEMIGREEIDNANMGNLQRQDGIEMRGQGVTGGFGFNPMNLLIPGASLLPMAMSLDPIHMINKTLSGRGASGGFLPIPFMGAMSMMGLDPMKHIRGLIGMGKNKKDILYYPKDEVSGGFLNPMTLMSLANMAPSLLKNLPLGAIVGKGLKDLQFLPNPEYLEKISKKGVKGGAFMDTLNNIARSVVNNPVVKNEARQALNRFNQSNFGQDLAEARRIRAARGGFTDQILGAMDSTNTAKSLGARLALANTPFKLLPTFAQNRLLGLIGLGKNKKDILFYPEVKGGNDFFNLFEIAKRLPSFLKDTPLGGIFGKGKDDFEFQLNPELMKKIQKRGVKGGAFMDAVNSITHTIMTDPAVRNEINKFRRTDTGRNVINTTRDILNTGLDLVEANKIRKARGGTQYLKDFGAGFLMVNRPIGSLANTAAMASALPIPGAQFLKPIAMAHNLVNGAMGFLTGNGDPREYRRPSHSARNKQLAMANERGIETSDAKGGYVHRPTKMHGGAQCGNMSAIGGSSGAARSERAAIVKQVMNERGVGLIEASKIVKNEGLY
jgi:hypothetical protein